MLFFQKGFFFIIMTLCVVTSIYADDANLKEESKGLVQTLVDSYVDASKTDTTLKYLLDAKMSLSTAEHDLLVSQDKEGAQNDIESTLNYLLEAEKEAKPGIKSHIEKLVEQLKRLENKTAKTVDMTTENETDKLLIAAKKTLVTAKNNNEVSIKNEIDEIINRITKLRKQIEHKTLKSDYESAMQLLNEILKKL